MKVRSFKKDIDKDCLIIIDEVAITNGKIYDPADKVYLGSVTLTNDDNIEELADNGLVILIAGIAGRWKQPVAFHYTSKSCDGPLYYPVIIEIIRKAEQINLRCRGVVSDMGGSNQGLWRLFGIGVSRFSVVRNKCINPAKSSKNLYFFHDPAHGWKNLKEGALKHEVITIPDEFVKKYKLPTSKAEMQHFFDLVNIQKDSELLLAPGLKEEMISGQGHFKKMRVENTSRVFSHDVSCALKFLAEDKNRPELKTTGWLVEQFNRWWRIISCRNLTFALSLKNPKVFKDTINFLKEFIELVTNLLFGRTGAWKPFQTGIIISTQSLIELTYELLSENYEFVIPGRFSQDCLENLFSSLRIRNPVMNALQFKNNLKLVCVAMYLKTSRGSSYEEDDRNFLLDFMQSINEKKKEKKNIELEGEEQKSSIDVPNIPIKIQRLNNMESNILHNIAGYLIISIVRHNQKVCRNCITELGRFKASFRAYSRFTELKRFKDDSLFFVSHVTFQFFIKMECIFRTYFSIVKSIKNLNLHKFFVKKFDKIDLNVPDCHHMKIRLMNRFATFRLKTKSERMKKKPKHFSSKSMAMHHDVK